MTVWKSNFKFEKTLKKISESIIFDIYLHTNLKQAQVAELVDALVSNTSS